MDTSEDPDTEEALKGFDFLSSPDEMDTSPESRGNGDGTDWGESWITAELELNEKHYLNTTDKVKKYQNYFLFMDFYLQV